MESGVGAEKVSATGVNLVDKKDASGLKALGVKKLEEVAEAEAEKEGDKSKAAEAGACRSTFEGRAGANSGADDEEEEKEEDAADPVGDSRAETGAVASATNDEYS